MWLFTDDVYHAILIKMYVYILISDLCIDIYIYMGTTNAIIYIHIYTRNRATSFYSINIVKKSKFIKTLRTF